MGGRKTDNIRDGTERNRSPAPFVYVFDRLRVAKCFKREGEKEKTKNSLSRSGRPSIQGIDAQRDADPNIHHSSEVAIRMLPIVEEQSKTSVHSLTRTPKESTFSVTASIAWLRMDVMRTRASFWTRESMTWKIVVDFPVP